MASSMASKSEIQRFKVMLIGDGGVGKSTFINRHISDGFYPKYVATLGVDVHPIVFQTTYGPIAFDMWDTAGQEKFGGMADGYYIGAKACIAMFDMSSIVTYKNLPNWVEMYQNIAPDTPIFVCGSKSDIMRAQVISTSTYYRKLQERGIECAYGEVSAKNNHNCRAPFLWLARKLTNHPDLEFL